MAYKECQNAECDEYLFEESDFCKECGKSLQAIEDLYVALSGKQEKIEVEGLVKMKAGGQLPPKTQVWRRKWGKEVGWREVEESVFSKIWKPKPKEGTRREEEDLPPLPPDAEPKMKESKPGVEVGKTVAGGDLQQNISVNTEGGDEASGKGGDGAPDQGIQTGKVLAGGDVVQNISQTSHTNVYNQDETKKNMTCCVSGGHGVPADGQDCSKCKGWALKDHFNTSNKLCENCDNEEKKKKENAYGDLFRQCLSDDNQIDREERSQLDPKARELGLSEKQRKEIEDRIRKERMAAVHENRSERQQIVFENACGDLMTRFDADKAYPALDQLRKALPNDEEVLWHFMLAATWKAPEVARKALSENRLFQQEDSPEKFFFEIELLEKENEDPEIALKEAMLAYPASPLLEAKQRERVMDLKKVCKNRPSLADPKVVKEPFLSYLAFVDSYQSLSLGKRNNLEPVAGEESAVFFFQRKLEQRPELGVRKPVTHTPVVTTNATASTPVPAPAPQVQSATAPSKPILVVLTLLLLVLVGPFYGPVPAYLGMKVELGLATILQAIFFLVPLGIICVLLRYWMRLNQRSLSDLGWRKPTKATALVLGILLGLTWGSLGVFSYHQFNPTADVFEISLFRTFIALIGVGSVVLEDFVMRGFLMNELERLKASLPIQMAASSSVYALCHTVWAFSALSFALNLFFGFLLSGLFAYGKRSLTPVMVGHGLAMIIAEPFLTLQMLEIMKLSQ